MLYDFDECFYSTHSERSATGTTTDGKRISPVLVWVCLLVYFYSLFLRNKSFLRNSPDSSEASILNLSRWRKDHVEEQLMAVKKELRCVCLICMQAFQLLKLSISPVVMPMCVLDGMETSCVEYKVALHVHISTQRIATCMQPAHTHARRSPPATYAQSHTYTHKHPDSITRLLVTHKHTY